MNVDDRAFEQLRGILSSEVTEGGGEQAWFDLVSVLRGWPDVGTFHEALEEATRQLERWPDGYRDVIACLPEPRCWFDLEDLPADWPFFALARALRLDGDSQHEAYMERFWDLPEVHDGEYDELVRRGRVHADAIEALAGLEGLGHITHLDLANNGIGFWGARELARKRTFPNLTSLSLYEEELGDEGFEKLSRAAFLKNLRSLAIRGDSLTQESARRLAKKDLGQLVYLDLRGSDLGDEGARLLARSKKVGALTTLNLAGNGLGAEGAEALIESDLLAPGFVLDLSGNKVDRKTKTRLEKLAMAKGGEIVMRSTYAASPHMPTPSR